MHRYLRAVEVSVSSVFRFIREKKEDGRRKMEDGRRKMEEGRWKTLKVMSFSPQSNHYFSTN